MLLLLLLLLLLLRLPLFLLPLFLLLLLIVELLLMLQFSCGLCIGTGLGAAVEWAAASGSLASAGYVGFFLGGV